MDGRWLSKCFYLLRQMNRINRASFTDTLATHGTGNDDDDDAGYADDDDRVATIIIIW